MKKIVIVLSLLFVLQAVGAGGYSRDDEHDTLFEKNELLLDMHSSSNEVIDQSTPMGCCGFYNTFVAQSFRPTLHSLTRVEIPLFKYERAYGTVKLSIRNRLYGPDLTSITLSIDKVPSESEYDWVEFDFEDIDVIPGQRYYMVFTLNDGIRAENNEEVFWIMSLNNPYLKGKPYQFYRYIWLPLWLLTPKFPDCSFRTYGYESGVF